MFSVALPIGIFGLFLCIAGYRYLKKSILISGFGLVCVGCIYLAQSYFGLELAYAIGIGAIAGIFFSFFLSWLFELAIFFYGATAASLVYLAIMYSTSTNDFVISAYTVPAVVLFFIGGFLSLIFRKYFLIVSTSFVGTILIVLSFFLFTSSPDVTLDSLQARLYQSLSAVAISSLLILILSLLIQLEKLSFVTSLISMIIPDFSHEYRTPDMSSNDDLSLTKPHRNIPKNKSTNLDSYSLQDTLSSPLQNSSNKTTNNSNKQK